MFDMMFQKSSPGGIMGHRYFDLRHYLSESLPAPLAEIANRLRHNQWE
jgi:hypothetical protein